MCRLLPTLPQPFRVMCLRTSMVTDRKHKLGLRDIQSLPPNSEIFDGGPDAVPAFGARRRSGGSVTYFVMIREDGRLRRLTIGRHGDPWTTDRARQKAREIVAEAKPGGPSTDALS